MIPNQDQDQDQDQQLITTSKVSSSNSQSKINNMADSSNLESIGILVLLGTRDGQYKVSLKKVNDYYKNVTNSKTFNITENFSDFFNAFKSCNSIGTCSILTQVASNCYILYNNVKDIIHDREYHKKMIQFMIDNTGKIYNDINILHSFINYNNSYMYCYQNMSNVEIFKLIAQLQTKLCPDLLFNSLKDDTHKNIKFDSSLKKKIKVGFVSDFLSLFHSVSKDRLGIIKHLNNDSEFDVTIMTRKTTSPFYNKIIYGKDDADIKYNSSNSNSNMMKIIIMDENDFNWFSIEFNAQYGAFDLDPYTLESDSDKLLWGDVNQHKSRLEDYVTGYFPFAKKDSGSSGTIRVRNGIVSISCDYRELIWVPSGINVKYEPNSFDD